jgi:phosphatidylglycerophosphate synthase
VADQALTEGERWAQELLAELREARYRPAAWARFLERSLARARETRAHRLALSRQARRWGIAGTIATAALARLERRSVAPCVAWWAACWAMLEWHLGMVEGPLGEHRGRLAAADAVTLTRIATVPFVAGPTTRRHWALLVGAGAASDAVDGRLAQRSGPTRLGRELDSCADAAFFVAAAAGGARNDWLSRSAALVTASRYLVDVAFVACRWFADGSRPTLADGPTRWAAAPSAAALLLAAAGARKPASRLLITTSLAAGAAQVRAARRS